MGVGLPDDLRARFKEIGQRLAAFRKGSGLSAADVAGRLGISRSNLYRMENGEIAKIETLYHLSEVLDVSVNSLLGTGIEFIANAVTFFERVRQIDSTAQRIVNFFGPISYILTSDAFDAVLRDVLSEALPMKVGTSAAQIQVRQILDILAVRKADYRRLAPDIVTLVSVTEIENFLRFGPLGSLDLPEDVLRERRRFAAQEAGRIADLMEALPIGVQAGIFPDALPSTPFQITRQVGGRTILQISPFRLGIQPNIRVGVAMITDAEEAVRLHEDIADELWSRAIKGRDGAEIIRAMIRRFAD
jgi:transcriptional regulator with XRE-family HTH domain